MDELACIVDALAFVEGHLQADVAVADIADAAGYSLYHFCRVFNAATHHTPYNYLVRRRLAEAARALVTTNARVIDIALDYQFNNPETFTRACRRVFDATPSALREFGALDAHRLMPALTPAHLTYLAENRAHLRPVVVRRQPLRLAGLMTSLVDEIGSTSALWGRLEGILADQPGLVAADRYAVRWYPTDWVRCGVIYLAAVALPGAEAVSSVDLRTTPVVLKTLDGGPYVNFRHRGARDDLRFLFDYVYHTWLPNADRTLAASYVLEYREAGAQTLFFPLALA